MHSTSKTKMMTLLASNISAHSNYLTLFTVLNIFLKLMFISYLTYEMLYLRSGTRTQPLICVGCFVHYWVSCAINKGGFFEIAFVVVVYTH